MHKLSIYSVAVIFAFWTLAAGQETERSTLGTSLRVQKVTRDIIGKNVTLTMKDNDLRSGTLVRADAEEFVLENQGELVNIPTSNVRTIVLHPGVAEGSLVALSALLLSGFGLGVAALSLGDVSPLTQIIVAVVFGIFGGWLGYGSFFQDTIIELQ